MTEQELIQQLRHKDEQAFRWLVENYRNRVFNTILNITRDNSDAEDAAQEVFIQVYESIATFREESGLSTWIYKIAVRKAIDKTRRKKRISTLQQLVPWWMPDEKKSLSNDFHHPGIALEHKEKAVVLFSAINRLPESQKIAFTLIKVQDMSYEEASNILGQSIKAVESLISRAKVNLQKHLEKYYKK